MNHNVGWQRIGNLWEAITSVKVLFLLVITICYLYNKIPLDWVYATLFTMVFTFREGQALLRIWKGESTK